MLIGALILAHNNGVDLDVGTLRSMMQIRGKLDSGFYISGEKAVQTIHDLPSSHKHWKHKFFFISGDIGNIPRRVGCPHSSTKYNSLLTSDRAGKIKALLVCDIRLRDQIITTDSLLAAGLIRMEEVEPEDALPLVKRKRKSVSTPATEVRPAVQRTILTDETERLEIGQEILPIQSALPPRPPPRRSRTPAGSKPVRRSLRLSTSNVPVGLDLDHVMESSKGIDPDVLPPRCLDMYIKSYWVQASKAFSSQVEANKAKITFLKSMEYMVKSIYLQCSFARTNFEIADQETQTQLEGQVMKTSEEIARVDQLRADLENANINLAAFESLLSEAQAKLQRLESLLLAEREGRALDREKAEAEKEEAAEAYFREKLDEVVERATEFAQNGYDRGWDDCRAGFLTRLKSELPDFDPNRVDPDAEPEKALELGANEAEVVIDTRVEDT